MINLECLEVNEMAFGPLHIPKYFRLSARVVLTGLESLECLVCI